MKIALRGVALKYLSQEEIVELETTPIEVVSGRLTFSDVLGNIVIKALSAGLGYPVCRKTSMDEVYDDKPICDWLSVDSVQREVISQLQRDTIKVSKGHVSVGGVAIPYWGYRLGISVTRYGPGLTLKGPWTRSYEYRNVGEFVQDIVHEALLKDYARRVNVDWRGLKTMGSEKWVRLVYEIEAPFREKYEELQHRLGSGVWGLSWYTIRELASKCRWREDRFRYVYSAMLEAVFSWKWRTFTYSTGVHTGEVFDVLVRHLTSSGVNRIWQFLKTMRDIINIGGLYYSDKMSKRDIERLSRIHSPHRRLITAFAMNADGNGFMEYRWVDWDKAHRILRRNLALGAILSGLPEDDVKPYLGELTWWYHFGRIPTNRAVKNLPHKVVERLRPNFRYFMKILKKLGPSNNPHAVLAAAKLAIVFGHQWQEWVRSVASLNSTNSSLNWDIIHDAGIELDITLPADKEAYNLVWKYRRDNRLGDLLMAVRSRKAWPSLGIRPDMPLREILERMSGLKYEGVRNPELAIEAARFKYSQMDFDELQDNWDKFTKLTEREEVPSVEVRMGDYRMYRLSKTDPRGLMLGNYTNCCQHPQGAGAFCAYHGQFAPDGAFYVIEKYGTIIAQSWTWRVDDTVVFDNIETLDMDGYGQIIEQLYKKVANELVGRLGVKKVHVGVGYSDVDLDGMGLKKVDHTVSESLVWKLRERWDGKLASGFYTDAYRQYELA